MKKTIGVLGGMGPEATALFFKLIIERTRAGRDQEHIPIIIDCDPRIPDRTEAILGTGPSPVRPLLAGARRLARAGADFIVMPCLSAHAFLPQVEPRLTVPLVSLVDETCRWAVRTSPRLRRVGLLATTGTVRSGIFDRAFGASGIEVMVPSPTGQRRLMNAVYGRDGIKAGHRSRRPGAQVLGVCRELVRRGAQAIVAGCTEIPLALADDDLSVPLIEPMRIAAEACIRRAGYPLR